MLVSLLRQLIVLLPAAFLLAKLGVVEWVWYAFPIAETFSLLATIVLYLRVYKRQIQNLEQEPSPNLPDLKLNDKAWFDEERIVSSIKNPGRFLRDFLFKHVFLLLCIPIEQRRNVKCRKKTMGE